MTDEPLNPYERIASMFDMDPNDQRVIRVVGRIIDKGYDPNEFLDSYASGGETKATKRKLGPVDARGMRTTGTADPTPSDFEDPGLIRRMIVSAEKNKERRYSDPLSDKETPEQMANARQLARGADRAFFNLPTRLGPKSWGEDLEASAAEDATLAPGADYAGQALASALGPGGLAARGAAKLAAPIVNAAARGGRIAGAAAGAATGAAAVPVVGGALEAGQALSDVAFADERLANVPRRALDEANRQLRDPINMGAGIVMGGAGGYAKGLRRSNSQTGEDIRLREEYGGKPSLTEGAQGGAFEQPGIAGRRGTTRDVANLAEESAESVRTGLNKQAADLRADYGAGKASVKGGPVDVTDEIDAALDSIAADEVIDLASLEKVRARVTRELQDKRLAKYWTEEGRFEVPPENLHNIRRRFDRMASTGEPGQDDLLRMVADRLRTAENKTGFGPLNEQYAEGIERVKRGHSLLNMGKQKTTKADDFKANTKAARKLRRGADNTATAGHDDPAMERFAEEFPEFQGEMVAPRLLAAKNRMSFAMGQEGGTLYDRFKSFIPRNMEPLEANVGLPLGEALGKRATLPGAVGTPMQQALEEYYRRKDERDRVLRERYGR